MIDHVLGRPSTKSRRLQVLAVLSLWGLYLHHGSHHGPPGVRRLSRLLSARLTAWQVFVLTVTSLYAARNFSALVGLASPEPMANMYDATYFRATWVLTAMDAGFWTAMRIRNRWARDLASVVFSVFYLFAAERADEKVRKVRGTITVEHMRVAWNKGTTPYLRVLQSLMRPRFTKWPPRQVRIPRPQGSDYREPVSAWLYFDGPLADLARHDRVVLDVPGGGFVAMDPRCNDDKLFAWAAKSGLPVLSLDYKKAPEFPYPYALNEVFDVYATLVRTRGRCIGMGGDVVPRIVVTGDSAGGNLVVAATLMILETSSAGATGAPLPPPDGVVCFYPALDMNIGNWMTDEQMSLIRDRKFRKTNRAIVRRKSRQYTDVVGTPYHSEDEDEASPRDTSEYASTSNTPPPLPTDGLEASRPEFSHSGPQTLSAAAAAPPAKTTASSHRPEPMKTRLATSSMISYVNDRVLTPEMMRAMIILYIGEHNRPDFARDYLLSPVLAPEALLARFPKTYLMTGERDPLVDDTVIFAGRLRRAKEAAAVARSGEEEEEGDAGPEVVLIPGASHGFMQFPGIYPPSWRHFARSAEWFEHLFGEAEAARRKRQRARTRRAEAEEADARRRMAAESSGDEERPLEIGMTRLTRGRSGTVATPEGKKEVNGGQGDGQGDEEEEEDQRPRRRMKQNKSLLKLKSTDDLLGRRMAGVASGLTGTGEED
ncbi:Alpha/beta hydrolase fold-3 [Cordyceps fumosorosea ARSEF 2679]|uniref:Alpha/beta hydrolase fold-3 n=1 Tax=Cordyceps fumosorosea (strain ARSEF 2679) TaxID=1081104 RepID=A0A167LAW3_CORFA|nr:Alpha/beta hydrolase fold-3 [Cordyceps fumosorosea ARSEF 2679]OAA52861.1 Alpha/beta hydrolase fold-3 [Cordyceps fumosorosea ARSEF 2679]